MHHPPAPPSKYARWVPRRVDEWILRALSKEPRARPQDAYEFISKLYELQFVNDGTSDSVVDINTTAPTLARLKEAIEGPVGPPSRPNDIAGTDRTMMSPPVEGPSLESAPPELVGDRTELMGAPEFSARTLERGALATMQVPGGVDRGALTRTAVSRTKPVPKSDTERSSFPTRRPPRAQHAIQLRPRSRRPHPPHKRRWPVRRRGHG